MGWINPKGVKNHSLKYLEKNVRTSVLHFKHILGDVLYYMLSLYWIIYSNMYKYNILYVYIYHVCIYIYNFINNPPHIKWGECSNANRHAKSKVFGMQINITRRYHFTPIKMAKIKRQKIASIGKDVGKLEPWYSAGESVTWWNHFGKQCGNSLNCWK